MVTREIQEAEFAVSRVVERIAREALPGTHLCKAIEYGSDPTVALRLELGTPCELSLTHLDALASAFKSRDVVVRAVDDLDVRETSVEIVIRGATIPAE